MTELMDARSNSASLPTKCLTVAKTPSDWTPRTYPAARRPDKSGSSE